MWDPEPWLQLHLLTLRKNGLHSYVFGDLVCLSVKRPSTKVMDFFWLGSKGQFVNCWEERGAKSNYLGPKC